MHKNEEGSEKMFTETKWNHSLHLSHPIQFSSSYSPPQAPQVYSCWLYCTCSWCAYWRFVLAVLFAPCLQFSVTVCKCFSQIWTSSFCNSASLARSITSTDLESLYAFKMILDGGGKVHAKASLAQLCWEALLKNLIFMHIPSIWLIWGINTDSRLLEGCFLLSS